ncbi:unnamed protein product [Clavelina lepadiformis]|uniref:Mediator of RNA polymerase II transcription subunit 6 n=1 Tax=Clavelina lepadiformis TaxID=159417 RepID=A0ABP0FL05_CLALP
MAIVPHDKVPNQLSISWFDSAWVPHLNKDNVLDYFAERSNPFYDRTCNNETIRMQRLGLEHLENLTGLEYVLLHHQEPILYVIRKQRRHSQKQVTTLADYYIIAGTVYQAPDVGSIVNSRLMTTLHHLESAFSEALSFSRYHPAKGYSWEFKEEQNKSKKQKKKEEPGSVFQCKRVDTLLSVLTTKFPPKFVQVHPGEQPVPITEAAPPKPEVKSEKVVVTTSTVRTAPATRPNPQNIQVKQEPKTQPEKRLKLM